ncbi:MAG: ABC transporter permease [Bacteroidota bacterium]
MLKNYIITAWRSLQRNKIYAFINVFCLSVGITGAILISLFIHHEFSFDSYHENHENLFRIEGIYTIGGNHNHLAITPFPLGPALKKEFSQVKEYVRLYYQNDITVNIEDKKFIEDSMAFADSTFFDVFTQELIWGNPDRALAESNSVVLSQTISEKYFGKENPLGKNIRLNQETYMITGVMKDFPDNTHLDLEALLSMSSLENNMVYSLSPNLFWSINTNFTYILFHENTQPEQVLGNMTAFHEKYTNPVGNMIGGFSNFTYTPLREVRFSKITFSPNPTSKTILYVLSIVAIFLVIIAAVNYTNLATARASIRSKEIGIRKVSGAGRGQLILQFLSESVFIAFISLVFSFLIIEFILPGFNHLSEKSFHLVDLFRWPILFYLIMITLFTGLLAGFYPSLFISRMSPSTILRGSKGSKGGSVYLRKALVVFQFAISIMLITGTLMVQSQLKFLQNKDLGLKTENRAVLRIQNPDNRQRIETLENIVKQNPDILQTTKTFSVPGRGFNKNAVWVESEDGMNEATVTTNYVDEKYFHFYEIDIIRGRTFDQNLQSDAETSIVINESAARTFGWIDNPLGKTIQWQFDSLGNPTVTQKVIGVVKDHNLLNLNHAVEPVMYMLGENQDVYQNLIVQYVSGTENKTLEFLEQSAYEFDAENFPNISLASSGYREQFENEERLSSIFSVFAVVCILISFIGLFGLSSFITEQRKREIGVRKVLGSSSLSILGLFYKEFTMLILISILITIPIAWVLLDMWLNQFIYRISIIPQPFIVSSIISLLIALVTVSYHTLRAANINPAEIIRSE